MISQLVGVLTREATLQTRARLGIARWPNATAVLALLLGPFAITYGQAELRTVDAHLLEVSLNRPSAAFKLSSAVVFELGGAVDDRSLLHRVSDVAFLRDGSIAVANAGSAEIKVFDARGSFLASTGRRGNGPGEFSLLSRLWVMPGDTIVAADGYLRRFSLFTRAGRHIRTQSLETPPNGTAPVILALLDGGRLVVGAADVSGVPPSATPHYFMQHLYAYDLNGKLASALGTIGLADYFVQPISVKDPRKGNSYWDLAFGRKMHVRALGSLVAIGDGATFAVKLVTANGDVRTLVQSSRPRSSVTPSDVAEFRRRMTEAAKPGQREMVHRMVAEMPYPKHYPAYRRFEVDNRGRLWVQEYKSLRDSVESWWVISPKTGYIGRATLPAGLRLLAIGERWLATGLRGEDDEELIRVYGFEFQPSGRAR